MGASRLPPEAGSPRHASATAVGFAGLGLMGEPMALNLARSGVDLIVWNRTAAKTRALVQSGARAASPIDELFALAPTVILMLTGEAAVEAVLDRAGPAFAARAGGHTIVQMGTTSPDFSRRLESDIAAAGGSYVEAPVSGSRVPAERGQLAVMVAGDEAAVARVRPLLGPLCASSVECGAVPAALLTKLAVNLYLIASVTGLAESAHFAAEHGLRFETVLDVINGGPLASDVSRVKGAKLRDRDFSPQASIRDVLMNNELIAQSASAADIASPLLEQCRDLYRSTVELGRGDADMVAVVAAIEEMTASRRVAGAGDRQCHPAESRR